VVVIPEFAPANIRDPEAPNTDAAPRPYSQFPTPYSHLNINLVAFSSFMGDLVGQVFALFVLTVAAGEAAIGLAIVVVYFRNRGSIAVEDINMMKG